MLIFPNSENKMKKETAFYLSHVSQCVMIHFMGVISIAVSDGNTHDLTFTFSELRSERLALVREMDRS